MTSRVELAEFQAAYLAEVAEFLSVANTQLLAAEAAHKRGEHDPRVVRELFRAIHTVKGLSAMVGVEPVVEVAHRMESVLRAADRAGRRLRPGAVDGLLQGVRAIEQRVRALGEGRALAPPPPALLELLDAIEAPEGPAPAAAPTLALAPELANRLSAYELEQLARGAGSGRRALRGDFVPSPARAAAGLTINAVRERVGRVAEIVKVVPLSLPRSEAAPGGLAFVLLMLTSEPDAAVAEALGVEPGALVHLASPERAAAPAVVEPEPERAPAVVEPEPDEATGVQRRGVVRVDVARLDAAMEGIAALVVTRFRLERVVNALPLESAARQELARVLGEHARQLRDLRAAIVRVRMVDMHEALERVPLLVRGLARTTGKPVRLELEAGRAELDKAVAERIFPAIVHLVRNAVDHAIEPPEERRRLGKPAEGRLRVVCTESGDSRLRIRIEDDGRGVDAVAVAARAGRPVPATDAGLLDLLCTPGLSTRDEATATSGRGMGMDIVRRVVTELGGELQLATTRGVGTAFTLRVPVTISIVSALSFECAGQRFVVPVALVEEVIEVDPAKTVTAPGGRGRGRPVTLVERRGEALPLVPLDRLFGLREATPAACKALVVRHNDEPLAFCVDRMLGQQEVVVRPLEDPLLRAPGVAGATDLGDGRPTLVLDLVALGASLQRARAAGGAS